jgi:hypothetical protein
VSRDDIELYLQITLAAINLAKAKYGVPVIVLYLGYDGENSFLQGTGFSTEAVLQRLRDGGALSSTCLLARRRLPEWRSAFRAMAIQPRWAIACGHPS